MRVLALRLRLDWLFPFLGALAAAAAATAALWGLGWPEPYEAVAFWVLASLALTTSPAEGSGEGATSSGLEADEVWSPALVVYLTAAFAIGIGGAMLVAAAPPAASLIGRAGWRRTLSVSGRQSLCAGSAGLAFFLVVSAHAHPVVLVGAAITGAVAAAAANTALVASEVAVAGEDRRKTGEIVRHMARSVPTCVGLGLVALMVAVLYQEFGLGAMVFLSLPVLAVRFVRQAKLGLDAARDEVLMAFVRATEEKDPFTYRHSERVAAICVALHEEMGESPAWVERRRIGALLHDVGKVAVPALILTKPGALTGEEYDVVKRHPLMGAEVARRVDIFNDLTSEILFHHERMDGLGYPYGLRGTEIPKAARVLAVADAFEALTSDRHYRPALSTRDALAEIERSSGSQFDAEVIAALRALVEVGKSFDKPARGNVVPLRSVDREGVPGRTETGSS